MTEENETQFPEAVAGLFTKYQEFHAHYPLEAKKATAEAFMNAVGKEITALELTPTGNYSDDLIFTFTDGTTLKMKDNGQDCCEIRYITTDDNLEDFVGATLMKAEVREAPMGVVEANEFINEAEVEYLGHEVQFLLITTSLGVFTLESHNINNGYYSGFVVCAEFEETDDG